MIAANKVPFSFFLCLFATLFLAIFYNTDTNMAGLYIVSDLGGSRDMSVYALVFFGVGCLLSVPLAHFFADRFGAMRCLVYTLLIYALFSLLCGLSSTFFLFILSRIGLGWTAGICYIVCARILSLVTSSAKQDDLCTFFVTLGYAIVPVLGVSVGGWLAYDSSWRNIFYMNEPIAVFLAGYFWFFYRHLDAPAPEQPSLDLVGYSLFVVGVGGLLTAMTLAQELDWYRSDIFVTLTLVSIVALLLFIFWVLISPRPILNIRLLARPNIVYGLINFGLLFACYFGMIILITSWLHIQVNYTPLWIGLLMLLMVIAGIVTALVIRRWFFKFDPRYTLAIALLVFMGSCYYSTYFNPEVDLFHLAIARLLAGVGVVLFLFPLVQLVLVRNKDQVRDVGPLFQITRIFFSNLGAGGFTILWQRRTAFFHSRLGEDLTATSTLTQQYFYDAGHYFFLTPPQATAQLDVFLNNEATSLALNDIFGLMGYICLGLFMLLVLTFILEKISGQNIIAKKPPEAIQKNF